MEPAYPACIEENLRDVPKGTLKINRNFNEHTEANLFMGSFQSRTAGKGKINAWQIFPGIQFSLNDYLAEQVSFRHEAHSHVLEINHCRAGRI